MTTLNSLMGIGPFKYLGHPNSYVLRSGGGGSSGVSTVDSVPEWYKPYIQTVAGSAVDAFRDSQLGRVSGLNAQQEAGIQSLGDAGLTSTRNYNAAANAVNQIGQIGTTGELASVPFYSSNTQGLKAAALYDADKAYSGLNQGISNANATGGARAGLLKADHQRGVARQFADLDYQDMVRRQNAAGQAAQASIGNISALNQLAGQPAQYYGQAGQALQDQSQAEADATYKGLAEVSSILSGTPQAKQTAVASGGK